MNLNIAIHSYYPDVLEMGKNRRDMWKKVRYVLSCLLRADFNVYRIFLPIPWDQVYEVDFKRMRGVKLLHFCFTVWNVYVFTGWVSCSLDSSSMNSKGIAKAVTEQYIESHGIRCPLIFLFSFSFIGPINVDYSLPGLSLFPTWAY